MCTDIYLTRIPFHYFFFFFNDTATTEIYTLSLHDALPISPRQSFDAGRLLHRRRADRVAAAHRRRARCRDARSEEHTSELQSRQYLVCRLLLEKKKKTKEYEASQISIITSAMHEHWNTNE